MTCRHIGAARRGPSGMRVKVARRSPSGMRAEAARRPPGDTRTRLGNGGESAVI